MPGITGSQAKSLVEAYQSIYNIQEQVSEDDLAVEILEEVAYALISQGHTAVDVLEYFANVDEEVIIEDLIALSEGTLIIESVVSEEYIEEQMQELNEVWGALAARGAGLVAKVAPKVANVATKLGQKAANVVWKGGSKATPMGKFPKGTPTAPGTKLIGQKNILQKAVGKVKDVARGALNKLPGGSGGKIARAGKFLTKGALGGAALELGMRGVKALMDRGSDKPSSAGAPKPKGGAGMVYVPGKGERYYSSSDKKYYKNYNDALAARNSRRGVTPTPASSTPAAPAPAAAKPSTAKPAPSTTTPRPGTKAAGPESIKPKTPNPLLDDKSIERMRQASQIRQKSGAPNITSDMIGDKSTTAPEIKKTDEIAKQSVQPEVAPNRATGSKKPGSAFEQYDAYDVVLEYLFSEGHVDTLEEAHYVMMEMDGETIADIVENRGMAYSGGKPGASGDGSRPKGITGGTTYKMKGWDDDTTTSKKPKVKEV